MGVQISPSNHQRARCGSRKSDPGGLPLTAFVVVAIGLSPLPRPFAQLRSLSGDQQGSFDEEDGSVERKAQTVSDVKGPALHCLDALVACPNVEAEDDGKTANAMVAKGTGRQS